MPRAATVLLIVLLLAAAVGAYLVQSLLTADPVTYHGRVSRILQENCVTCHRAGGIGPFPLTSYEAARENAPRIRAMVGAGRMPPSFADSAYGEWADEHRLTKADRRDLLAWIEAGAPEGDPDDAPPRRAVVEGWQRGEAPDTVLRLPEPREVRAEWMARPAP